MVTALVSWGDQLVFHIVLLDALLECIGGFIDQYVLYKSKPYHSHPVDNVFISPDHLFIQPVAHGFDKDIVGVEVGSHHYVPVAMLGR